MIKIENCKKSFASKQVLKGISFSTPKGSIFGFAGINGAGKSTLIKCVLKFLNPDSGNILIGGIEIGHYENYKKIIGYLPEVFQPPLDLKCGEFLNYCNLLINHHRCSRQEIIRILERVGLPHSSETLIRQLSKGMRQRLGFAQTIIHDPKLLILDEPFSGLDPIGRYELKQLFRSLNSEGITLFFSSHNLNEIQDLCSHMAILHDGKIAASGTVREILDNNQTDNLEQAFLSVIHHHPIQKDSL